MSVEEILGFNGFTEQPVRRTKKRGGNWVTTHTYEGPRELTAEKEDELLLSNPLSISSELGVPAKIETETEEGGGTIEIGQAARDIKALKNAIWTLNWDRLETDIRNNSHFRYIGSATEMAFVETIDTALAKGTAHLNSPNWDTVTGVAGSQKYYEAKIRGINSFIEFAPIMRCTITAQATTELKLKPLEINAGKIVPWFDTDDTDGVKVVYYPDVPTPTEAGFEQPRVHNFDGVWTNTLINQWMVYPPSETYNHQTQEIQFIYEWHGAVEWSGWLYDGGTGKPTA